MTPREQLTPKEIQIATLVWEGMTNREISRIVATTEQVIKNHLRNIFDKIGVSDRLELALFVVHHRILAQATASIPLIPARAHAAVAAAKARMDLGVRSAAVN